MIRGKKTSLAKTENVTHIHPTINASIHNRFDIEVVDAKTGEIKQRAYAENVVCQAYWDLIFATEKMVTTWFLHIAYGSGSGTPSSSDTTLFSAIGHSRATLISYGLTLSESWYRVTKRIQLLETAFVGKVFTEVGIGTTSSIYTHAMLKDMNGNQISLTKSETDIFNIYATVYLHLPKDIFLYDSPIQNPYNYLVECWWWLAGREDSSINNAYSFLIALSNNLPTPLSIGGTDVINWKSAAGVVRDATNKKITCKCGRIPASSSNYIGGARYVLLGEVSTSSGFTNLAMRADPEWLDPSLIVGESLGTGDGETTDFVTNFDFPYDAKVYVNGVESTAVTVDRIGCKKPAVCYLDALTVDDGVISPIISDSTPVSGDSRYYFNSNYENGIVSFKATSAYITSVYCSDDAQNWTSVSKSAVPDDKQHSKYWKFVFGSSASTAVKAIGDYWDDLNPTWTNDYGALAKRTNVHFETPPPDGAVITIDYKTDVIAKDENHVFDLSVTIQFGEYTGE